MNIDTNNQSFEETKQVSAAELLVWKTDKGLEALTQNQY
jgi:hypothetical protein